MSYSSAARIVLVATGGTLGTGARLLLSAVLPELAGVSVAILVANSVGAFLLGLLAAWLPGSSSWRIFLGTGVLGGFTTYSALTVGTVTLWQAAPLLAALYAVGSLILGVAAAALGLRFGRRKEHVG